MANGEWYVQQNIGDVAVVRFSQEHILDAVIIEKMGAGLKALIDGEPRTQFVLDFNGVNYLSSSALGMLISLQKKVAMKGGQLKLSGIKDSIMEVFRITKLDEVFDIYKNQEAAIEAFGRNV
ncbi:MAG: STAS domain-containing protein [Phycisphaerae bacterium]|nr:STAS domain-containing protein [Phycisphaerae bacterium]